MWAAFCIVLTLWFGCHFDTYFSIASDSELCYIAVLMLVITMFFATDRLLCILNSVSMQAKVYINCEDR